MNAGTNYGKAREQAQANADFSSQPRWLYMYNGVWWISKTPVNVGEKIEPKAKP